MKLYPHQVPGVAHLLEGASRYLADTMGLGKTVQAIVAACKSGAKSVLVICPARVIPNWEEHWREWGDPRISFRAVSYASRDVRNHAVSGEVVILDEAHYVKNRNAKRTGHALAIASKADRVMLLSGTPGTKAVELWTVFDALWPDLMKLEYRSYEAWRDYFCTWYPVRVGPYTTVPKITGHRKEHVEELRGLLSQVILRRTEDDDLDLPPLSVHLHTLPADSVYNKHLEANAGAAPGLEQEQLEDNPSSARLRRLLGTLKAPMIADLIAEELKEDQYQKIVVGYHHRDVGDILYKALQPHGLVRLDGRTPMRGVGSGIELINLFNQDPNTRVFLGQMVAAGVGLNLQVASEIALVEPAWTPDPNRQFIKRVHRIGQDRAVRARIFAVQNSMDQGIMRNVALHASLEQEMGL